MHHPGIKESGVNVDVFAMGFEPLALLLFFGNITAARAGLAKLVDVHRLIHQRVRQGVTSAQGCVRAPPHRCRHSYHATLALAARSTLTVRAFTGQLRP